MPIATAKWKREIKTGRRDNPAINGARDKTVCFMLSDVEKESVDRVAFCMQLTRSGVLANVVAQFVTATETSKQGCAAEKGLSAYVKECRKAVSKRGAFADKVIGSIKGKK